MPATVYLVPTEKRTDLDQALSDDLVARQSRKVRDASALGGPSGSLYVMISGSADAVARAETLLGPVGKKLPKEEADSIERKFREEDEASSSGMGLFFTE